MEDKVVEILLDIKSKCERIDERTLNQEKVQEKVYEDLNKRVKVLEDKNAIEEGQTIVRNKTGNRVWGFAEIIFGAIIGWFASTFSGR